MSASVVIRLICSFLVLCCSFSFSLVSCGDLNTLTGSVSDATLKLAVNSLSSGSLPTRADVIGLTIDVAQKFFGFNLFGSDPSTPAVTYAQVQELLGQLKTDLQNDANANVLFLEYNDIYSQQQQAAGLFANGGGCINQLRQINRDNIDNYRRDWKNGGTLKDQFDLYCWNPLTKHSDQNDETLQPLYKLEALQDKETWNGRQVATRRALDALVLSIQLIANLKNQAIKIQSLLNPDYDQNAFATSQADLLSFYSTSGHGLVSQYIRMRNLLVERRVSMMGETLVANPTFQCPHSPEAHGLTPGFWCIRYYDSGQLPKTSGAVVLAPTPADNEGLCFSRYTRTIIPGVIHIDLPLAAYHDDEAAFVFNPMREPIDQDYTCLQYYINNKREEIKSYITRIDESVCGLVTAQTGDDACWMTSDNPRTSFAAQASIAEFYSEPNFHGRKRVVREHYDFRYYALWGNHRLGIAFRYDSRLTLDNPNFQYQDCDTQTIFHNQHHVIQGLPFIPKSVKILDNYYQYMAYGKFNHNMHNCGSLDHVVGSSWGDYRVLSSSGNFRDEWSSIPADAVHMIGLAHQGQFQICNKQTNTCLGEQPHMGVVPNWYEWPNSVPAPLGYWFSASATTKDAYGWYFHIRADDSTSMRDATHTQINQLLAIRPDYNMLLLRQNGDEAALEPTWQVFPNEWGLGNVLYRPAPTGDRFSEGSYALGTDDKSNGHITLSSYYTATSTGNGVYEIICGSGFILDISWPTLCRPPTQQARSTNIQDQTQDIQVPIGAMGGAGAATGTRNKINAAIILALVIPITVVVAVLVIAVRWYVVRARARNINKHDKHHDANTNTNTNTNNNSNNNNNNNNNNTNPALAQGGTNIDIDIADDQHHHVNI